IGGSMDIREGDVGCARCGHRFGPAGGEFKKHLAKEETAITEAGPLFVDPSLYVDDHRIRLYRFYCPGCAALLSVTVSRTDDPVLEDFELSTAVARR
ncbi:MAG: hypothetical protein J2P20_19005, partial [Pseudonocardia sp.]|nr:hypothetical protein [Pseudonocardia sp.]